MGTCGRCLPPWTPARLLHLSHMLSGSLSIFASSIPQRATAARMSSPRPSPGGVLIPPFPSLPSGHLRYPLTRMLRGIRLKGAIIRPWAGEGPGKFRFRARLLRFA
jgi:hypothetical protein